MAPRMIPLMMCCVLDLQNVMCLLLSKDMYGRSVATCSISREGLGGGQEEELNAWLVENGNAVAYR